MSYNKRCLRLTLYPKSQCGFLVEALISPEMDQSFWRNVSLSSGIEFLTLFLVITWRELISELCCTIWNFFILFLFFVIFHVFIFHANFHFAALTSPLQLLLVLCPPPLSVEIAWLAFYWPVVSVAPQIEHMFDLGSTWSTPLKYRAPVATWDRLHIEKLLVGGLHIYSKPF